MTKKRRQYGEGVCKFCGDPIQWAVNRTTGARTPLDPEPDPHYGRLLVDEWSWTFIELELPMIERALRKGEGLYVNHLTRCPNAPGRPRAAVQCGQTAFT